jgi:predicted GIY-YIG superfamily endonuclease
VSDSVVERCYLYRFFDAVDRLLYVGITRDVGTRFAAHRRKAGWWSEVVRCEYLALPDRASAEAAEALAIVTERPLHNASRLTPETVEVLRGRATSEETDGQLRVVAEVERLRRLSGEQYVRLVRFECDNAALVRLVESLEDRLRWARSDSRQSDALLAQLSADRAIARHGVTAR